MTDFLEEKKNEIEARMNELRPLVDEFHRLEAAAAALSGVESPGRSGSPAARGRAPRRSSGGGSGGGGSNGDGDGRRGRPKGSGTRAKEALELVRSRPGVTIPEIAEAMGIKQNYLYRVMPELQKDGMVKKEGRGWVALDAA
jgi:CRP-like cAMP-binding protein